MEASANKGLLEEWAAAWSSHDTDRVVSLFTDDCVYEDIPLGAVNRGKEELKAFADLFFHASPDLKVEVASRFVAGNSAAIEWTMSGTHEKDLPGMPATGKRYSFRGATVIEFNDCKIKRNSDYWDLAMFMKQLGFIPS